MADELTAYIMEENGVNKEEAEYMLNNPCVKGPVSKCEGRITCEGCPSLNGYLLVKTSDEDEPKPTKYQMERAKHKNLLFLVEKSDSNKE